MPEWHLVRVARSSRLGQVDRELSAALEPSSILTLYRVDHGSKVKRPLFQTPYLFVAWPLLDAATWHVVRWMPGVVEIVGGAVPATIPEADVESWRRLANDEGIVDYDRGVDVGLQDGDIVSFDFNAFENKIGFFRGMQGKDAAIEIAILGRTTVVYIPVTRVFLEEKAPENSLEKPVPRKRPRSIRRGGRRGAASRQRQRLLATV